VERARRVADPAARVADPAARVAERARPGRGLRARTGRRKPCQLSEAGGDNGPVPGPTTPTPPAGGAAPRPWVDDDPPEVAPGAAARRTALAVGAAVVAVVAAALAGPWDPPVRGESLLPWTPPSPVPVSIPPQIPPELQLREALDGEVQPWDLTWLGLVLAAVLLLWIVLLVGRWLRRHPVLPPPEAPDDAGVDSGDVLSGPGVVQPDLPALREAVAGADLLVRRHVRPSDAVIAAWVHLEQAAARSGVPRDPAQTPTEFTVAVLDRTPVDPAATRTLLDLYLRARFGGERMAHDDVAAAVAALGRLAEGLGQPEAAELDEIVVVDEPERDEPGGTGGGPGVRPGPDGGAA